MNDLAPIYGLTGLRFLQLKCNNISTIPKGIERLSKLETLWLEEGTCSNNEIISLPSDFAKLPRLKALKIGGGLQQVFGLPENFHKLAKLEKLEMKNIALEGLPKKFHLLDNLKHFSLTTDHRFTAFPNTFKELEQLEEFYFQISSQKPNSKISKQVIESEESFKEWGANLKRFLFQIQADKIQSIGSN